MLFGKLLDVFQNKLRQYEEMQRKGMNEMMINRYCTRLGQNLRINGQIRIDGSGELEIGNGVSINSGTESNPIAGVGETSIILMGGKVVIKDGAGISNCSITSMECVEIGEYAAIGAGTMIADTDFHSLRFEDRIERNDFDKKHAAIVIGRGAFIGARCIILKGVTIGEKAIIGAGSVVARNIPAGEVWAGNPARFIRKVENETD